MVQLTFQSSLPTYSYSAPLSCDVTTDFTFIFTKSMNGDTTLAFISFRADFEKVDANLIERKLEPARLKCQVAPWCRPGWLQLLLKSLINAQLLLCCCQLTGRADGVSGTGEECVKALGGHPAGPSLISGTRSSLPCQLALEHTVVLIHDRHLQKKRGKKNLWKTLVILERMLSTRRFRREIKAEGENPHPDREKRGEEKKSSFSSLLSQGRLGHLGKVYSTCSQKHYLSMSYVGNDAAHI